VQDIRLRAEVWKNGIASVTNILTTVSVHLSQPYLEPVLHSFQSPLLGIIYFLMFMYSKFWHCNYSCTCYAVTQYSVPLSSHAICCLSAQLLSLHKIVIPKCLWHNVPFFQLCDGPFALWCHFTTTKTRILHDFAFLSKLGLLFIKAHLDYQIYNVNMKGKTKRILAVVVKWNHCANGQLQIINLFAMFMYLYVCKTVLLIPVILSILKNFSSISPWPPFWDAEQVWLSTRNVWNHNRYSERT